MGCASSKGAAAIPATGNGNAPNDSGGPLIVVTDTLKPPDVIVEGDLPPNQEQSDDQPEATVEGEAEGGSDVAAETVDDTDEVVREIHLAVPEVTEGDEESEKTEESPAPEAEAADEDKGETDAEEAKTADSEEPMDTNDETLLKEIQEEEAPKVIPVEAPSEE